MDVLLPILLMIAFVLAYRLGRKRRAWAAVVASSLLLPLLAFSILLQSPLWEYAVVQRVHYLPWRPWLFHALAVPLVGCVAGTLEQVRVRRLVLALGVLLFVHGIDRNAVLIVPTLAGQPRAPAADHHLHQSGTNTCVAAATAIALSYAGVQRTEREMAFATRTYRKGTSLFDAYRALAMTLDGTPYKVSLHAEGSLDPSTRGRILVTNKRDASHAITLIGLGNRVSLHDPLLSTPETCSPQRARAIIGGPLIELTRRGLAPAPRPDR